jgi:hypothetical protein
MDELDLFTTGGVCLCHVGELGKHQFIDPYQGESADSGQSSEEKCL